MIKLEDLNEVEQKAVMFQYIKKGIDVPQINGEKVDIPHRLMVGYRCHKCKEMKYVRLYKIDMRDLSDKIGCRCDRNAFMRIRNYGASNIKMLTSSETVRKIYTLDDFF